MEDEVLDELSKEDIKFMIEVWNQRESFSLGMGRGLLNASIVIMVGTIPAIEVFGLLKGPVLLEAFIMVILVLISILFLWSALKKIEASKIQANESNMWYNALERKINSEIEEKLSQ